MLSGFNNPEYGFHTVFDFGERQFDDIFEQGDSKAVIAGLRSKIATDKTGLIASSFAYFGWPINGKIGVVTYDEIVSPYIDAAAALHSKKAALQNYHDELQDFLKLRDKMKDHPDFPGYLPETYFSGGDLDPKGAGFDQNQTQFVF